LHITGTSHALFKPWRVKNNYDIPQRSTVQLSL
jgi:hypothetical protein